MRERIKLSFSLVTGLSLILFFIAGIFWINQRFESATRENLGNHLRSTIALQTEIPENPQSFVEELATQLEGEIDITLIDPKGTVVADSRLQPERMDNHLDREEFVQAAREGWGEALRQSETAGRRTVYVAAPWTQGYLLRFSMPLSAAYAFTVGLLPVLLLSLLAVFGLSSLYSGRLVQKLIRPYSELSGYIEGVLRDQERMEQPFHAEYEELQPIVSQFRALALRLQDHVRQVTAKTREVENIVGAMEEGLVLLDAEGQVLLLNGQGSRFLDLPAQVENKKITHLCRDEAFAAAFAQAGREGQRQIVDLAASQGGTLRMYINPVPEGGTVLLISDVTEMVRLERMRSEFAANVSHELKTPLTSISGFAELIQEGLIQDPEQIRGYAGKIHGEAARLVDLIQDIIRLSAIEGGAEEERRPVDMAELFREVLELLAAPMEEKAIESRISGNLVLLADRERMRELAMNLCDNAVKYNNPGGRLQVDLLPDGFRVSDTGIGIPQEELQRVFERFYRVDKARSRKTGGTGLGLSIVKHIAELYGGSVNAESDGDGTRFTVRFPGEVVAQQNV